MDLAHVCQNFAASSKEAVQGGQEEARSLGVFVLQQVRG